MKIKFIHTSRNLCGFWLCNSNFIANLQLFRSWLAPWERELLWFFSDRLAPHLGLNSVPRLSKLLPRWPYRAGFEAEGKAPWLYSHSSLNALATSQLIWGPPWDPLSSMRAFLATSCCHQRRKCSFALHFLIRLAECLFKLNVQSWFGSPVGVAFSFCEMRE